MKNEIEWSELDQICRYSLICEKMVTTSIYFGNFIEMKKKKPQSNIFSCFSQKSDAHAITIQTSVEKIFSIDKTNFRHYFAEDDFQTADDLRIAYFVLQQQVKVINGNEKNILIPADCLKAQKEPSTPSMSPLNIQGKRSMFLLNDLLNRLYSFRFFFAWKPFAKSECKKKMLVSIFFLYRSIHFLFSFSSQDDSGTRDCIVCCEKECQVACMPCGHFSTCVPCGHSLKTCPMCRAPVKSLVRVFL